MSKTKFTPGPWKACLNVPTALIPGHIVKTDDPDEVHRPIASIWEGGGTHGKESQIANTYLIAAAPEIHAALADVLAWHKAGVPKLPIKLRRTVEGALAKAIPAKGVAA